MLAKFQVLVGLQQRKLKQADEYMVFPATDYRVSECYRARGISEFYCMTSVVRWLTIRHTWIYPRLGVYYLCHCELPNLQ